MRVLGSIAMGVAVLALGASSAGADADRSAECKDDGWRHATTTGAQPFKNQGDCVQHAARGGTVLGPNELAWLGPQPSTPPTGTPASFVRCDGAVNTTMRDVSVFFTALAPDAYDLAIAGTLIQRVDGGTFEYRLSFDGVQILQETLPLSAVMTLPDGPGALVWRAALRTRDFPSGMYRLRVNAVDEHGDVLSCTDTTFQL